MAEGGSGTQAPFIDAAEQDSMSHVLHTVAQPLTVLCTVLHEASRATQPTEQAKLLVLAQAECERAITALRRLQKRPSGKATLPAHHQKAVL